MPKALLLSYSCIDRDPRVLRQLNFLQKSGFEVVLSAIGYQGELPFYQLLRPKSVLSRLLKLGVMVMRVNRIRAWDFMRHSSSHQIAVDHPDIALIIANDAETWPIASYLKKKNRNVKIVFDAHEFYLGQFTDNFKWNWFHKRFAGYLCKQYIPQTDLLITVCDGLAKAYAPFTPKEVPVVLNAPKYEPNLTPKSTGRTIQIVHHGIANRSRKIEKMIELMNYLDPKFELNFILMPTDKSYLRELKKLAKGKPIKFLKPVGTENISTFINQFDIGLFYLEPVNYNYTFALPNKFFEFIQARLAIAIGPSEEMKKIVHKERLGIVSSTFNVEKLASELNKLSSEDIDQYKANANQVAQKYSADEHDNFYKNLIQKWGLLNIK